MQLQNNIENLLRCLERLKRPRRFSVAVMPDFFLDRIISVNRDVNGFAKTMDKVVARKGGSIDSVNQADFRGGNAANTTSALATLGVEVYPILETSLLGFETLKFHFKALNVDLSQVKTHGETSLTTALEFVSKKEKANVMLRNLGSLEKFGSKNLDAEDFELLKRADYVCVFNWAGTRLYGTELAEKVFSYVKKHGKGKTYYDTADPTPNREKIQALIRKVFSTKIVDILSVNENEATIYANHLLSKIGKATKQTKKSMTPIQCTKLLAETLHTRVDLHTARFAASQTKRAQKIVQAFKVPAMRVTGAGDAWNAGKISGES